MMTVWKVDSIASFELLAVTASMEALERLVNRLIQEKVRQLMGTASLGS